MRLVFAVGLLLSLGGEAAAFCRVPVFQTPKDAIGQGTMTTTTGRDCRMGANPLNSDSISFTQPPRNDTVTIPAAGVVVYKSKPGFVGEDSFAFTRSGYDDFKTRVVQRIRVAVTVVP